MWIAVLGVALGSLVMRVVPVTLGARLLTSDRSRQVAELAGTAALAALVAGSLVHTPSGGHPGAHLATGTALAVGLVAARATDRLPVILVAGLTGYWATVAVVTAL